MSQDPNDYLFGGGAKSFAFEKVGDKVKGKITDVKVAQQTSMEGNTPLTWDDGSPRMQLVITLATDLRDPDDDADEGERKLYAKGGKWEAKEGTGKSMKEAIADAVKGAKARSIDEGAELTVAYTGIGKAVTRGYSPPKLYTARYAPPVASVTADELFDD